VGGECSTNNGEEDRVHVTDRRATGKRPLGRQRHQSVDNIRMNVVDIGWSGVD
jgi:hypothetical protein